MVVRSLRTRFLLAGIVFISVMGACGAWSVVTIIRLSAVIGDTLRNSQEKIDLTASLASGLEREDDALLLSLTGNARRARSESETARSRFEEDFAHLQAILSSDDERAVSGRLRQRVDNYRQAGDALFSSRGPATARETYHERVNPALREAVADCGRLRELSFLAMRQAGLEAEAHAKRATRILATLVLATMLCVTVLAIRLAWTILGPIRELTKGVEAVRNDDFSHRVKVHSADELGQLAEGYNRMAETLTEYRNSSLGELLLAKATLESTLSVLPDAVILVDGDGRIEPKNSVARALLQSRSSTEPPRLNDLPLPDGVMKAIEETLLGDQLGIRQDPSQAIMVQLTDKTLRLLATVARIPSPAPFPKTRGRKAEKGQCGAVLVLADVTEFARLDELRSELVAVASHELKTPLTSLRMDLLLLRERADNLTTRQLELLRAAVQATEELSGTIDELLDLTRIEAGQLRLQRERVDLNVLVEECASSFRLRFEDATIRLRIILEAEGVVVSGDSARLRIVIRNLLDNALKYTASGGEIEVRVARSSGTPQRVNILVTDSGPGVPVEFQERIFEKFFRVEHHQQEEVKGARGAGIGLYLCRQIVDAHGGSIRCETRKDGTGTRFFIDLPAAE